MVDMTRQEIEAAVAAVSQGQLPQVRLIVDGLLSKIEGLEGKDSVVVPTARTHSKIQGIEDVTPPENDAKGVDVRDTVIELTERFNQLLGVLKGSVGDAIAEGETNG